MKSYFARLADRATPAPQPAAAPAPAREVNDPFAETAPPLAAAPAPTRPQTNAPPFLTPRPAATAPPVAAEPPAAPLESPPLRSGPTERVIETTRVEPRGVKFGWGQTPTELNDGERRDVVREAVAAAPPRKIAPPVPQPPPAVQPTVAQSETAAAESVETARDEQRDERQLLRKADAFMERLLDRSRRTEAEPRAEARDEVRETLPPRPESQPAVRIQPVDRQPRAAESAPEPPSLVIGSLTVEVIQPPPPAPVSPPRIVVVRGARGARTGIRSSRSFGLRQF
jgi:hypothetical protein